MIRRPHDAEAFASAWARRGAGSKHPTREDVGDLIRTAELLCASAQVEPDRQFTATLRERLMTEAATVLTTEPAESKEPAAPVKTSRGRRWLATAAAVLVAAGGTTGLVTSSANAVPGDALYSVKRGVEAVQLSLRPGSEPHGAYQLDRASERLREAKELVAQGASADDRRVSELLDDFSSQTDSGAQPLLEAYSDDESSEAIETLERFTTRASTDLKSLAMSFGDASPAPLRRATDTIHDVAGQISKLCQDCTEASDLVAAASVRAARARTTEQTRSSAMPSARHARPPNERSSNPSALQPTSAAPAPRAPQPTAPQPTASQRPSGVGTVVKDTTKPIVGALLGDEKQRGLVPGLLDTLLGRDR